MAKAPTSTTPAEKPQPDEFEIDDDIDSGPDVAGAAPADPADDDDSEPERGSPEREETPREAAVRRYRELRDARLKGVASDDDAASDDDEDETESEAPAPAQAKAPAKPAPVAAAPASNPNSDAEPEVELTINGATVRMKQSDVIAHAQVALASKGILDEVKALREETLAQRGRAARDDDDSGDDDDGYGVDGKAETPRPAIDAEKLENIVERIQIGDKEEGREALAELIQLVGGKQGDGVKAEEIGRVVTEQIARARIVSEIEDATTSFRQKYDALVADPDVLNVSISRLAGEVRQDLISAGLDKTAAERATPDQLMELHTQARIKGIKVRPIRDHLDKVGADMTAKFAPVWGGTRADETRQPQHQPGQPEPSSRIAERMDRKRQAAAQPRTAGVRATSEPAQKPKSRTDVLMEMRRSRGFSV